MTPLRRIAVIGNSLPRRCGIATFSTDLQRAISNSRPNLQTCIVAMTDHDQTYDYPASVALQIKDGSIEEYVGAAAFLNAGRFDIVCLQHEFGIFGGDAGAHILELLSRLRGHEVVVSEGPDYRGWILRQLVQLAQAPFGHRFQ